MSTWILAKEMASDPTAWPAPRDQVAALSGSGDPDWVAEVLDLRTGTEASRPGTDSTK